MQKQMFDLLEGWLRHKSDMVNFEAARAICEMRNVTAQQLTRSIAGRSSCAYSGIMTMTGL
jgi:coatomer subunit gamma